MPFTVTMPKLSPTMEGGTIAKWHKKVGDKIRAGELLIDVVTDKATIEYEALDDGYLRQILVGEGKSARVNHPIAIFTVKADESIVGISTPGNSSQIDGRKGTARAFSQQNEESILLPKPCSSPLLHRSLR